MISSKTKASTSFLPGRGPGPRGTGQPKPKIKNAKGTIVRLLKYLAGVKWELIFALSALMISLLQI